MVEETPEFFQEESTDTARKFNDNTTANDNFTKEARPASIKQQSSWDTDVFAQRLNQTDDGSPWKNSTGKVKKKPARVQDIAVGLFQDSAHVKEQEQEKQRKKQESWPYEDSPCRLYGGKNTKPTLSSAAMNKDLFDSDFSNNDVVDFSDADSFCGDTDGEQSPRKGTQNPVSRKSFSSQSSGKLSTKSSQSEDDELANENNNRQPNKKEKSHTSMLAWNKKKQDSEANLDVNGDSITKKGELGEMLDYARRGTQQRRASTDVSSVVSREVDGVGDSKLKAYRTFSRQLLNRSSSLRALNRSGSDKQGLGRSASTHGRRPNNGPSLGQRALGMVKKYGRRPSTKNGVNGDKSKDSEADQTPDTVPAMPSRTNSRRIRKSNNNSLSATVHASAAERNAPPRRRAGTRGGTGRTKSGDGMVPMPGTGRTSGTTSSSRSSRDELGAATLHGKSSISRIRKGRKNGGDKEKRAGGRGAPERRILHRAMSTANVKRPEEYAEGRGAMAAVAAAAAAAAGGPDGFTSPRQPRRRVSKPKPVRRDVIELLRKNEKVTENDLMDKDNRRILHCLMMEHKLEVTFRDLASKVRKETKKDGSVPQRPKPPLFVEA